MEENFVEIPIELDDKTLLELALLAHERNITLNQLINKILQDLIDNQFPLAIEPSPFTDENPSIKDCA